MRACVRVCMSACVRGIFAVQARQKKKSFAARLNSLSFIFCQKKSFNFCQKKKGAGRGLLIFAHKRKRGDFSHFFFVTRRGGGGNSLHTTKKKKVGLSHLCRQSIPIASQSWSSIWRSCLLSPHRCFVSLFLCYFFFGLDKLFALAASLFFFFIFFFHWTSLIH
jgi:hypothetical protein